MKTRPTVSCLLLWGALSACGSPTPGSDAGGALDTGSADTGSGALDTGTSNVQACEAAIDAVRAACVAEDPTHPRICLYDALRPLCTTGRTDYVQAVFECLQMDACQTPSDPSGARTCVEALIASRATATDRAFGAAICGCSASPEPNCDLDLPSYTLGTTMMMREADVEAARACTMTMGCAMTMACVQASPLAPVFSCP